MSLKTAAQLEKEWNADPRWQGVVRGYAAADVLRLAGTVQVEHTLARLGAEKLWRHLHEQPYVNALGALTGNQAMQQVRAGLKAIYLSGWQVAGDANLAGEMYPDQSLYPADSVPAVVRRINNTLLRADQICHAEGDDSIDWLQPIVADALDQGQQVIVECAQGAMLDIDYGTYPDQRRPYFTLRDARTTLSLATKASGLEGAIYAGLERLTIDFLGRDWRRDDGAMLRIERCLIDANWGSSTDVVYQFCRQSAHAGIVMPSHGRFVGASSQPFSEYKRRPGDRIGLNWRIPSVHDDPDRTKRLRELEMRVREQGFQALGVSALVDGIPAGDRRYYPLYAKAVELGIPARIYSSMNYATDRPYDLGHPRHLDQVAIDFPELTIIGGLGGWPWVNEMVALVRRHPKLHVDTSAHRAKYLGQRGSGWEMLIQFGNTLIQDKVMVGLSAGLVGQPHDTLIKEYLDLPLKDSVKEKWLYGNAARVFQIG